MNTIRSLGALLLAGWVCARAEPLYTVVDGVRVDARTFAGWRVLREFDCARCHGPTYAGSVGPSLLESVTQRSQEQFLRLLRDGVIERGMPGYGAVARVMGNGEAIYAYLKGRAEGAIRPGKLEKLL
ncbi:MAG: cytochrome c [Gammaproteobacteria bacterium]